VKLGGGHAGHNGLRSLVQHLGTPDFVRVRMGVGRPPAVSRAKLPTTFCRALPQSSAPSFRHRRQGAAATLKVLTEGVERAMNEANTRPKRPGGEGGSGASGPQPGGPSGKKGEGQDFARGFASRDEPFGMVPGGSLLQGISPWGHRPQGDCITLATAAGGRKSAPENTKPSMS